MDFSSLLSKKNKLYTEFENGVKELENRYYNRIEEAERNLREVRSERDRVLYNFRMANDLEKNEVWRKSKETEEDLLLIIYFKYLQLKGGLEFLTKNTLNTTIIEKKELVKNDWCELDYVYLCYVRHRKYHYDVNIIGKCLIPNKVIFYLNQGEYYLKDIEVPKSLSQSGTDWSIKVSINKFFLMHNKFFMEFKTEGNKNLPLFKKCNEIAGFIDEVNKRIYDKLWEKSKLISEEEIREVVNGDQRNYILEALNNRFDVNLKDFLTIIEE